MLKIMVNILFKIFNFKAYSGCSYSSRNTDMSRSFGIHSKKLLQFLTDLNLKLFVFNKEVYFWLEVRQESLKR